MLIFLLRCRKLRTGLSDLMEVEILYLSLRINIDLICRKIFIIAMKKVLRLTKFFIFPDYNQ